MKISGPNSLALTNTASNVQNRCGNRESIQAHGAKVLDAMETLGNLTTLKRRNKFEGLVKKHLDTTTRLAIRLTGNPDLAEELVQETMLRAVRNWESFREQSQFKTWLYRILINAFRDSLRRSSKIEIVDVQPNDCAAKDETAESRAEVKELDQIIGDLIARLPERQREVLVLTTYESLSNEQIAQTLNITIANVHSNLSTARRKLKQQLSGYLNND